MSHGKHFTLYSHGTGPNGWKVAFVLEELGLTYETVFLEFDKNEHKAPEFTKYNPNGRIPAIIDHKADDFVLWESDAILVYLVERYDTEHKISVSDPKEKITQLQWLFFQASGQGPYFGQLAWFRLRLLDELPSASERYEKETLRVLGVLESVLSKQEWLVGGKATIADISFIPWNNVAFDIFFPKSPNAWKPGDFPAVEAWHRKLKERPAVARVLAIKASIQ